MIKILGIPYDASSSFLRGAAEAPRAIRAAVSSDSANLWTESGVDLGSDGEGEDSAPYGDAGDLTFDPAGGTPWQGGKGAESRMREREHIRARVAAELSEGHRLLSFGGDHSVSYPNLQAYSAAFPKLSVIQFDAHADLYERFEGDLYSHACPFARIMEEELVETLIQVGVRTLTGEQAAQRDRFGIVTHEMRHGGIDLSSVQGPVYVSLDLDVLDPAFAPGVSHHEPGGLSTRGLLGLLSDIPGPIVGADIVELNPQRDLNGMTAMVAAKLAKELLARLLES